MHWLGLKTLLICVVVGVLGGGVVGTLIGVASPAFCFEILRVEPVFRTPDYARQIGTGLGMANGVWIGLVAGIALLVSEAIKGKK